MSSSPPAAPAAPGLRELKKQQTRDAISDIATLLFATRGFERTTIAEVARAANVAKMTVTNYFPLKEDLVFDRAETIVGRLAGAVSRRPAGRSVLEALQAEYADGLADRDPTFGFIGRQFAEMVQSSPALLARERSIFEQQEAALAAVLGAELGTRAADVRPRVAAAALGAVFRILYYEGRRRLLAGEQAATIVRSLRRAADAAFEQVRDGLPAELVDSV